MKSCPKSHHGKVAEFRDDPRLPGPRAYLLLNSLTSEWKTLCKLNLEQSHQEVGISGGNDLAPVFACIRNEVKEWSVFSWDHHTQSETQDIKEKEKENQERMSFSCVLGQHTFISLPKNFWTNKISNLNILLKSLGPRVRIFSKEASKIYHHTSFTQWHHSYFQKERKRTKYFLKPGVKILDQKNLKDQHKPDLSMVTMAWRITSQHSLRTRHFRPLWSKSPSLWSLSWERWKTYYPKSIEYWSKKFRKQDSTGEVKLISKGGRALLKMLFILRLIPPKTALFVQLWHPSTQNQQKRQYKGRNYAK